MLLQTNNATKQSLAIKYRNIFYLCEAHAQLITKTSSSPFASLHPPLLHHKAVHFCFKVIHNTASLCHFPSCTYTAVKQILFVPIYGYCIVCQHQFRNSFFN